MRAIASVIWNASVVHSFDHGCITAMMNDDTKPMPFVLRVPFDGPTYKVGVWLGEDRTTKFTNLIKLAFLLKPDLVKLLQGLNAQNVADAVTGAQLDDQLPLCWPADVLYAKMTDLLFYAPHNSSLLYDCEYAFDPLPDGSPPSSNPFPGRPWISDPQRKAIASRRDVQGN